MASESVPRQPLSGHASSVAVIWSPQLAKNGAQNKSTEPNGPCAALGDLDFERFPPFLLLISFVGKSSARPQSWCSLSGFPRHLEVRQMSRRGGRILFPYNCQRGAQYASAVNSDHAAEDRLASNIRNENADHCSGRNPTCHDEIVAALTLEFKASDCSIGVSKWPRGRGRR